MTSRLYSSVDRFLQEDTFQTTRISSGRKKALSVLVQSSEFNRTNLALTSRFAYVPAERRTALD